MSDELEYIGILHYIISFMFFFFFTYMYIYFATLIILPT